MKNSIVFIILFLCLNISIKAQKFEISYGTVIGLNTSFIDSKSGVDYNYPFHEQDKNFELTTSNKMDVGYNIGIFCDISPVESRFNFETGIFISKYRSSYNLTLTYDNYFTIYSVDSWSLEKVTENINTEFSIIKIPLNLGYNVFENDKYQINLFGGLSANINMRSNNTIVDLNMEEHQLYADYFISYQAGLKTYLNKLVFELEYGRSLNIQKGSSRDFFPYEMKVDKLYLNTISFSFGYRFN